MQKDELIQLHTFLLQLKTNLEEMTGNCEGLEFSSYYSLEVNPLHIDKSRREHSLAVFTLSKGIATLLTNHNCPGLEKISKRLDQMSKRFMTDKEKKILIPQI